MMSIFFNSPPVTHPMRLLLALLLCLASSLAQSMDDLYQVNEPLAADNDSEQRIALSAAFDTLLLRLTPNPRLAGEALSALRQNPQPLIVRYGKQEQTLSVEFDPTSTLRTLREQGLPLWTGQRPLLLVWWMESRYGENAALLGDAQPDSAALLQAAQHRFLKILLPLADLSEQWLSPETEPDAWLQATERYHSDGLLIVNAADNGRQLEARWQLQLDEWQASGTSIGIDRESLADMLLLEASQQLAARFAINPSSTDEQTITLQVAGANLERYAALSRTLAAFSARLLQVDGDKLLWQIHSDPNTLRAHLKLMHLQELPASGEAAAEATDNRLYFSW
ncbi:DUF2066 domain-containing protein [Ventosimonas gracilis]|nr:DUF2066 domain-containing protein [Ventosimonas gracilis]